MSATPRPPTEYQECADLARWLTRRGLAFTHVPMGGKRDRKEAAILATIGTKPGVPDYLVFSIPLRRSTGLREPLQWPPSGVAVEMKRRNGGRVSKAQSQWIETLHACGWVAFVAHGAKEAIGHLDEMYRGTIPDPQ